MNRIVVQEAVVDKYDEIALSTLIELVLSSDTVEKYAVLEKLIAELRRRFGEMPKPDKEAILQLVKLSCKGMEYVSRTSTNILAMVDTKVLSLEQRRWVWAGIAINAQSAVAREYAGGILSSICFQDMKQHPDIYDEYVDVF